MVHFLMTTDPHPSKLFQVECFLRSLELFGGLPSHQFSLILTSNEVVDDKEIKLIPAKTGNYYIDKRVEVLSCRAHFSTHPPVRWFVEPRSDMCVFIDSDVLVCSEINIPDKNSFCGMLAHESPCGLGTWQQMYKECEFSLPFPMYKALNTQEAMPYYVNFGVLFVPSPMVKQIREVLPNCILCCNSKANRFRNGMYYTSQIALSLTLEQLKIPRVVLPLRYNYPDILNYDEKYPDEVNNIMFYHYLGSKHCFENRQTAQAFVEMGTNIKNQLVAQKVVQKVLDDSKVLLM